MSGYKSNYKNTYYVIQKYGSLLLLLYLSNMVNWISHKLLAVFLTTRLLYFLKDMDFICVGHMASAPERRKRVF